MGGCIDVPKPYDERLRDYKQLYFENFDVFGLCSELWKMSDIKRPKTLLIVVGLVITDKMALRNSKLDK